MPGRSVGIVGIVGTGWGRTHVGTVRACGGEVAVIVGRDPDKTRHVAREEGVAIGTTDLAALDDVDVIVIASPTPSHAAIVQRFAHKPMICEKPLLSAAPDDAVARAIRAAPLYVNYAFSFLDTAECLAQRVRSGALGTIDRIDLRVGVSLDGSKDPGHWRLDVGSHPVAWLASVFGPFDAAAEETGEGDTRVLALGGPGPTLRLSTGRAARPGIEYAVELHGTRGRATLEGTYRVGGTWSFRATADDAPLGPVETSGERDVWYAANCRSVAAAMRALSGGARDDRLVDGTAALRLEAPLWSRGADTC